MTQKQREIIIRQMGVLEGLAWLTSDEHSFLAEAMDSVIGQLEDVLNEPDDDQ